MGVSKIILDGSAICDISSDTVDKSNLSKGTRAIGNSGDALTGEAIFGEASTPFLTLQHLHG